MRPGSSDSVVVGLLDGSLAALDTATGELRWRFKSGRPLVSSSASGGGLQSGEGPPLIFPGADGSLYTYQQDGEAAGVQKLPVTMPELVELSPSITVDNALVLGSKQTTVFVLDRRSGRLLKSFSTQDSATLLDADLDDQKLGESLQPPGNGAGGGWGGDGGCRHAGATFSAQAGVSPAAASFAGMPEVHVPLVGWWKGWWHCGAGACLHTATGPHWNQFSVRFNRLCA